MAKKNEFVIQPFERPGLDLTEFERRLSKSLKKSGLIATVTRVKGLKTLTNRRPVCLTGSFEIVIARKK